MEDPVLIYSGCGWLVAAVALSSLIASQQIAESVTGDPRYYAEHAEPKCAALLVSALVLWLIDRLLLQEVEDGVPPSFLFVPLGWWSPLLTVAALLVLLR